MRRGWDLGSEGANWYTQEVSMVLLNSRGSCAQYPGINHNGREYEKQDAYAYIYRYRKLSQFAEQQKLTQHWDSSLFQIYIYIKVCCQEPGSE